MSASDIACIVGLIVVLLWCVNYAGTYDTPHAVAKRRKKAIYRGMRRAGRR